MSTDQAYRGYFAAQKKAEAAGPDYARAFDLWTTIRNLSRDLRELDQAVAALPQASMAILEKAANAKAVSAEQLVPVLEAADKLAESLTWQWLKATMPRVGAGHH